MTSLNDSTRLFLMLIFTACYFGVAERSYGQSNLHAPAQARVYDGFTSPLHDVMVAASDAGLLRSLLVREGDAVEAGQVIALLEDELQRSAVDIAMQQAAAQGVVDGAVAELALQQQRTRMLRELESKNMSRPDEVRRAEADLQIAQARLASAQEQRELRKLELARYQLQLARREIRAPCHGVISQLFREPGEYISPNEPVVVRLLVIDRIVGTFNVPAEEIGFVKIGSPAKVYLRSTAVTVMTTIHSIAPHIDGESGTVAVRVELDNANQTILAGDRCTLSLSSQANGNANHRRSVSEQPGGQPARLPEVFAR